MKDLSVQQMEEINGGLTNAEWLGMACGLTVFATVTTGPAGWIFGALVGPTVCGIGLGLSLSGQ